MALPTPPYPQRSRLTAGLLLLGLITLIYSNTFHAAWQFDDLPNITLNPRIHLKQLDAESIKRALYASAYEMRFEGRHLFRPVSSISFALNWLAGQDNVTGYHVVNIGIHWLAAFWLYATLYHLLRAPNLPRYDERSIHGMALLAATLWAVHPIQTQAVTYIVQRMAALATLFTVGAIYGYLRFRLTRQTLLRLLFAGLCVLCFLLGVGSKENAAILPLSLVLLEVIFFQDLSDPNRRRSLWIWGMITLAACLILMIGLFYWFQGSPLLFFEQLYARRPFTMAERLLTEARVIFLYLSQLFWPSPERLSLIHDIPTSTSLWKPWSTMPAVLGLFGMAAGGAALIRRHPVSAFAILFFLLNHSIESTIIPLEIVFEHRNYMPSLFLFLPLATLFQRGLDYSVNRGSTNRIALSVFASLIVIGLGLGTYTRNFVWVSPRSLWLDVLNKAPQSARPYQNLADQLKSEGNLGPALTLYEKSLGLQSTTATESKALSLNNMGNIYVDLGEYQKAAHLFRQAIDVYPGHEIARYNLVYALIRMNQLEGALGEIDQLLKLNSNHNKFLNAKGFILFQLSAYKEALPYFRHSLRSAFGYRDARVNLGMTLSRLGFTERADWFLRMAQAMSPNDSTIMFCRIENGIRSGNNSIVRQNIQQLFLSLPAENLMALIRNGMSSQLLPFDKELVLNEIRDQLFHEVNSIP